MLLLLEPETRPVGSVHEYHCSAHDEDRPAFIADPSRRVDLTYHSEVSIPIIEERERQTRAIRIIPECRSGKTCDGDDEEV